MVIATFLELLATAAWTGSSRPVLRYGFATGSICIGRRAAARAASFLMPDVLQPDATPLRRLLEGISESSVFPARTPGKLGRIVGRLLRVFLEVLEPRPAVVDEAARESLLDERLEFDEAKQCNGALSAMPHKTITPADRARNSLP